MNFVVGTICFYARISVCDACRYLVSPNYREHLFSKELIILYITGLIMVIDVAFAPPCIERRQLFKESVFVEDEYK